MIGTLFFCVFDLCLWFLVVKFLANQKNAPVFNNINYWLYRFQSFFAMAQFLIFCEGLFYNIVLLFVQLESSAFVCCVNIVSCLRYGVFIISMILHYMDKYNICVSGSFCSFEYEYLNILSKYNRKILACVSCLLLFCAYLLVLIVSFWLVIIEESIVLKIYYFAIWCLSLLLFIKYEVQWMRDWFGINKLGKIS